MRKKLRRRRGGSEQQGGFSEEVSLLKPFQRPTLQPTYVPPSIVVVKWLASTWWKCASAIMIG